MSACFVAASSQRIGPPHRLHVSTSARNTCLYHHLYAGQWADAFPDARVHAPKGLTKKRPDLEVHRIHGSETEPRFSGSVKEIPIEGFRLRESVLFHRATGTLVVADLVHNVGRPKGVPLLAVASTSGQNCAIQQATGQIVCWGHEQVTGFPTGTFSEISVYDHYCALRQEDGQAVCWGGYTWNPR